MMRLPRLNVPSIVPSLLIATAVSVTLVPGARLYAQDAAVPAAAAAAPAVDAELRKNVENFWHYGKIGKYDLSADAANKVLGSGKDSVEILRAFESVAEESKDKLDVWMLRWQGIEKLKDVTPKLLSTLDEGRRTRRADPAWIESNIKDLAVNRRSYFLAIERIRDSGELAVPQMIDYLRDQTKVQYHGPIRAALKDLGQLALNPLVAATEMKESAALISVINSLAEIGYASSVPYLARLAQKGETATIQTAAKTALEKMGAPQAVTLNVGDQYYNLSESFYYGKSAIRADMRNPEANVWSWDETKGLQRVKVPHGIFNDIMSMRTAKSAMMLETSQDALSLWLAGNYKREVDLGSGKDATQPDGAPSAHFYGVAAGTQYLNATLARALGDNDAPVALKSVKSLQEIVGRTNLMAGPKGEAISDALRSVDRSVRFEAAFAVAAALPDKEFAGKDRVIPLMAEAIHQNGQPGMLLLFPAAGLNAKVDEFKGVGYSVAGGATAEAVITASGTLPAVDVVVASDEVSATELQTLLTTLAGTPRFERAAKVIISKTITASPDTTLNYTPASDAAGLKPVIEAARAKTGGVPMDEKVATTYALRSADLMAKLVINGNKILEVSQAQQSLLASLEDTRPDVVKAVANVLGMLNDKMVQSALASKAADDKAPEEVKIAAFKALATNAKNHGNLLDQDGIALVQKSVAAGPSLDVRSAAAEARGALNLPVDQAKTLILGH